MWIVSTVAAGLFFLSTNAAHDLLGVLPLFYADCEKPLAQTVTLLKTRCNGCICTDPVFSEQYAEQSCLGNTVCLLKPWTVFSQSRDTPQVPARWLLPTHSVLKCAHPVANTQGYLWPPKHDLLGAAGTPVSRPRAAWHGQQGATDVQRATLCSLLYKSKQRHSVFIPVTTTSTLPWPLHYELRLFGYASCRPPKTSWKTHWSRANRSHQFVPNIPVTLPKSLLYSNHAVSPPSLAGRVVNWETCGCTLRTVHGC